MNPAGGVRRERPGELRHNIALYVGAERHECDSRAQQKSRHAPDHRDRLGRIQRLRALDASRRKPGTNLSRFVFFRRRGLGGISTLRLGATFVRASGMDAMIEVQHCVRREQANGESLVKEESVDEYVVEQRKRSCWARAKHRFGGVTGASRDWVLTVARLAAARQPQDHVAVAFAGAAHTCWRRILPILRTRLSNGAFGPLRLFLFRSANMRELFEVASKGAARTASINLLEIEPTRWATTIRRLARFKLAEAMSSPVISFDDCERGRKTWRSWPI